MMNDIFHNLITEGVVCIYLDNILIYTCMLKEHRHVMCIVMECLRNYLQASSSKVEFEKTHIEYLGLIISEGQVEMDPVKVVGVGMARTHKQEAGTVIPWLCQLLLWLHLRLLAPRTAAV